MDSKRARTGAAEVDPCLAADYESHQHAYVTCNIRACVVNIVRHRSPQECQAHVISNLRYDLQRVQELLLMHGAAYPEHKRALLPVGLQLHDLFMHIKTLQHEGAIATKAVTEAAMASFKSVVEYAQSISEMQHDYMLPVFPDYTLHCQPSECVASAVYANLTARIAGAAPEVLDNLKKARDGVAQAAVACGFFNFFLEGQPEDEYVRRLPFTLWSDRVVMNALFPQGYAARLLDGCDTISEPPTPRVVVRVAVQKSDVIKRICAVILHNHKARWWLNPKDSMWELLVLCTNSDEETEAVGDYVRTEEPMIGRRGQAKWNGEERKRQTFVFPLYDKEDSVARQYLMLASERKMHKWPQQVQEMAIKLGRQSVEASDTESEGTPPPTQ